MLLRSPRLLGTRASRTVLGADVQTRNARVQRSLLALLCLAWRVH